VSRARAIEVKPGQVWVDNDPRYTGRLERRLRVERLSTVDAAGRGVSKPTHAECVSLKWIGMAGAGGWVRDESKRITRIRLTRFRPTAKGYRLVSDAPDSGSPASSVGGER
jgi:hypothetical protein